MTGARERFDLIYKLVFDGNEQINYNHSAMKRNYDRDRLNELRTLKVVALAVVAAVLLFSFVISVSRVDGNSMEPTLHNGQPVVCLRLAKNYERGDIASVRMPNGEFLVKRVVAVAGDTVEIRDGEVLINGEVLNDGFGPTERANSGTVEYPLTLKEGQIFVLGDNRSVSTDSRTFGPIAATQSRGLILGNR